MPKRDLLRSENNLTMGGSNVLASKEPFNNYLKEAVKLALTTPHAESYSVLLHWGR